jgi:DNA modification methylase
MIRPYYQDTAVTIYCGDCREIVPTLGRFDLLLTDPPYGIKRDKGFGGFGGFGKPIARARFEDDDWDADRPDKSVFDLILSSSESALIWGGNFFADMLPRSTHWIFWDKLQTMPTFGDGELAWTNFKQTTPKKFVYANNKIFADRVERHHPTQKPLQLIEWCIGLAPKTTSTVADPFMGSGTTGVACANLGKTFYGIEREPKYFDIACQRIENAYRQERLFA